MKSCSQAHLSLMMFRLDTYTLLKRSWEIFIVFFHQERLDLIVMHLNILPDFLSLDFHETGWSDEVNRALEAMNKALKGKRDGP